MRPYLLRGVPHARRPSPLPPDFRSPEHAAETLGRLLAHPRFYSVVAELDGRVVGSNFLDERSTIAGLGPITVDPGAQNAGVGRRLMLAAPRRAGIASVWFDPTRAPRPAGMMVPTIARLDELPQLIASQFA